jgi:hypothetical protein
MAVKWGPKIRSVRLGMAKADWLIAHHAGAGSSSNHVINGARLAATPGFGDRNTTRAVPGERWDASHNPQDYIRTPVQFIDPRCSLVNTSGVGRPCFNQNDPTNGSQRLWEKPVLRTYYI